MLTNFTINSFKSYKEATLKLAPLTVLIGANASGKSNLIEALRLFSWLAQGNKLGSVRYAVQEEDHVLRGTVGDLARGNEDEFSMSCETTHAEWNRYSITLRKQDDDELHIVDERLIGPNQNVPLFEVVNSYESGGDIWVAYNNFARGGRKPQVACVDQMSVLTQLQSSSRFEGGHNKAQRVIPEVTKWYQGWFSNMVFLDPQPSTMRGYSFKTERVLGGSGANLSGVLYNLCEDAGTGREVLQFIQSLPEQDIESIGFIETPRNEAMVELTESFGGIKTKYDATLLSDGTLRVLAIAAAVLSAPENSIVVIEEIDNGVHPSRAEQILDRLSRIASKRGLRVIISSHNPALLDALPDQAVSNVVFCYRDPQNGASRLVSLSDIPDYPELIAQGTVGHLMTRGILDRFVKCHPSPEERKSRARSWLKDLEARTG